MTRGQAVTRQRMQARRAAAAAQASPDAAARVAQRLFTDFAPPAGAVIAGYWPIGDEFDPRPALRDAVARGHPVVLPCVVAKAQPLRFRCWRPGLALCREPWGTWAPPPEAAEATPDLLLVPLLAFDRDGGRLGYGGGFYDRTLAALRAARTGVRALGLAWSAQELPRTPREDHDQRLDGVITESESIEI